jgi:hypothetical protein
MSGWGKPLGPQLGEPLGLQLGGPQKGRLNLLLPTATAGATTTSVSRVKGRGAVMEEGKGGGGLHLV